MAATSHLLSIVIYNPSAYQNHLLLMMRYQRYSINSLITLEDVYYILMGFPTFQTIITQRKFHISTS